MKTFSLRLMLTILGLVMALGNVWGESVSVTYKVTSTTAVSVNGTAPEGSSAVFKNTYSVKDQLTSGNSMTLTLKGYSGIKITGLTLSMKSNTSAGSGYFSVKAGTTTLASIGSSSSGVAFNDSKWNGAYTTTYSNVSPAMTNSSYVIKDNEDVVIVIGATKNSLYCQSFTIQYEAATQKTLESISIKTAPSKVDYKEGEYFNPSSLVITATYDDTSEDVNYLGNESDFTFTPSLTTPLQTTNNSVTICYGGKETTQSISVSAVPSHTASFSINGSINPADSKNVKEGESITFPAEPSVDVEGFVFQGWITSAIDGTQDTAPSFVNPSSVKMGEEDVTYYAVFATKDEGSGNEYYEFVASLTEGKKYMFVSSNTSGSAYALAAKDLDTPAQLTALGIAVNISADAEKMIISTINTDVEFLYNKVGDFDIVSSKSGEKLVINGNGIGRVTSNYKAYWNEAKGLYGTNGKGTTNYYVCWVDKEFKAVANASSRVYAFEKKEGASYTDYCTTVGTPKTLTSISVKTSPKVTYKEGEMFDPAGLVITCTYDDESTKDITYSGSDSNFSFNPELSTALTTSITGVKVTYKGKTCTLPITVNAIPSYVVTIITPENGTLVVKDGENVVNSGDKVKEGTVLTIEVNPAEGYKFRNWQAVDETTHTFTKGTEWTVNADVTIKANFDIIPTCTVNYWVNGDIVSSQTVKDNVTLEFPTTSDINNKKFMGWVTTASVNADNAPTYSTDTTLPNIENGSEVDYFAVFATESETEGGDDVYVKVPHDFTDWLAEGNEYLLVHEFTEGGQKKGHVFNGTGASGDFKTVTITDETIAADPTFVTITMATVNSSHISFTVNGGVNNGLMMNAKNGGNGMSFYDFSSLSNASDKAYVNNDISVNGYNAYDGKYSGQWRVEGYRTYLRFYKSSGDIYFRYYTSETYGDPIEFYLKKAGKQTVYSDYTTLPQPEFNLTVKAPKYATFYNSKYAIILPLGMKGYIGNYEGGKWNMIEKYGSLDIVPAGVPVIVGGVEKDYEMSYKYNNGLEKPSERNDLMGVDKAQTVTAPRGENPDDYYFYALSLNSKKDVNSVGFYWVSANGAPFSLGAHKVYLALPKSDFTSSDAKEFSSFVFDGEATGVEQLFNANTEKADMYNISGQRVNAGYKGIVIMNGKKIVVK